MRPIAVVLVVLAVGACTPPTQDQVCERLLTIQDARGDKRSAEPKELRMRGCLNNIKSAREAMGPQEWETFAPCAVKAEDSDAFVACSPTMVEAAEKSREKIREAKRGRAEAIKEAVEKRRAGQDGGEAKADDKVDDKADDDDNAAPN